MITEDFCSFEVAKLLKENMNMIEIRLLEFAGLCAALNALHLPFVI